jgi:hypothetical protein
MAINDYTIKYSSTDDASKAGAFSKPSFVVSERSTNKTNTSLALFGKYAISWGEELQTNLVRIMENSARDTPPVNATIGQLWFDTGTKVLKVYTPSASGPVWNTVSSGSSSGSGSGAGGSGTLAIATISSLGGIIVGTPFEISSNGTLSLPSVTYTAAIAATATPAEYKFTSNLLLSGEVYSNDTNNYIAPTATKPASYFNKHFITKAYADATYLKITNTPTLPAWLPTITPTKGVLIYDGTNAVWSKAGAANQVLTCTDSDGTVSWSTVTGGGSGVLPVATRTILGGVRPQYPLTVNSTGDISLEDVAFRAFTAATSSDPSIPSQYDFTANIKTTGDAYSADPNNNIGKDTTKAAADFDPYFVTKKYADMHYAAIGAGGSSTPTIATKTALGGIIVGAPFDVTATGTLSLPGYTYSAASSEYTIDSVTKMSKALYSSDQDNTVDADNSKPSTFYDGFYITKHYADSKYVKLSGGAGGAGGSYVLPTATPTVMGGVKVGDPLNVDSLGVLSLANITYDSAKTKYTFAAVIESSSELFSTDIRNKVDSDTTKPTTYYDGYFITKKYADTRYAPIGTPGGTGSTGTVATATNPGGIKVAAPFSISSDGTLALRQVTYTDLIPANPSATPPVLETPAEYVVDAAIKTSKWIYSNEDNNTIGLDATKNYDKYFITKKYADAHYAAISGGTGSGTAGSTPYILPAATTAALGGVKVGAPFAVDATGTLSLPNLTYRTAGTVNTYEVTANVKVSGEIVSSDNDNKIFSDTGAAANYYDKHFVTKHFADAHYMLATASYTLPPATASVLGGVKVLPPLNVSANGELSLPYFTVDNAKTEYSIAANIKTTLGAYSSDADNTIGKDATKAAADYDPYFVTKHYADAHYAPIASSVLPGSANFTVTEPLMVTGTVLSLRKVVYDSVHDEYRFAANLKALAGAYSADLDNGILKSATIPAADYEYYFTTKHYNDANYLKVGTTFDAASTAKTKQIIEYATGFQLSDLDGKDTALVTKKYVDSVSIGPNTETDFANKNIIFAQDGKLSESLALQYYVDGERLSVSNISIDRELPSADAAPLTIYQLVGQPTRGGAIRFISGISSTTLLPSGQPVVTPGPAAIATGIVLGSIKFGGWDGAVPYNGATIEAFSSEAWTETAHGCNLVLSVTKNGQKDPVPALTINNDNSVSFPGGIVETVYNTGSATWTLDPTQGSMQILTTAANTTITMPAAAALTGKSVTVLIKYTGAHTITWTGAISWESNVVPVPTSIAGTTDLFSFFGDGTKIYGLCGGQAFP